MDADTQYQIALIKAYLSPEDSANMPFEQAAALAEQLDQQAAAALEESVHTQLHLENAVAIVNEAFDQITWPEGIGALNIGNFIGEN